MIFQKEEERFVREVEDEEEEEELEETAMKDTVENDETDGINSLFTKKSVIIKYLRRGFKTRYLIFSAAKLYCIDFYQC